MFDEVPELYDRARPTYPDELFADLTAITGVNERSSVLEVGCGTGQATRSLASAWHWVDPAIGWQRAHEVVRAGGWMALLGHVVVRRPGEAEVYAETADLHERFCPGNPDWGDSPLEEEVRATDGGWGAPQDPEGFFGETITRWYPTVQWLDSAGFVDLLRTTSLYRRIDADVREPLLDAIAERIRTRLGDGVSRRYLSVLRVGHRADRPSAADPR